MARGRAFDSEASGSGTSRASSCPQPPVPPSLPSVPSSSTPLPGPIKSSPASQSPTKPEAFCMGRCYYGYAKWPKRNYGLYGMLTSPIGCEKAARSNSACLRRYERVGRKLGRILHSRESVTYLHKIDEAKKYGREPTPMEVFTYTHTKDHDGNTFVDKRALSINPLPSPLDSDTADDTLVTPVDTMTHPADTPADAMILDHAEDRPRRFDFRPF
ncbi:hypothetical protein JCGZ_01884 [Jatropha curcas]|uniref:Uncharacterized protein n=1 Tax=Jatropha curcas TaxID=180498 RepID=A0A067L0V1_JATCU|nr:hypothetical protein JCGZ_01884 [Jatropha curcas]